MKQRALLLLVLALTAGMLTACFSAPAGSGSDSSGPSSSDSYESSQAGSGTSSDAAYNPKKVYGEYGGTIDLRATQDLSKVAFCVNDKDGCRLVVNTGSGDKTVYTAPDSRLVVYGTQWSPDGNYVSFCSGESSTQKMLIYSLASGKVTDTGMTGLGSRGTYYLPWNIWSGDSAKVIGFSEKGSGYYDIASGKAVYLPVGAYPASFSPDGKLLAWSSAKDDKITMQMYDVATGTSKQVFSTKDTDTNGGMFGPVWLSATEFLISDFAQPFFHKVNLSTGAVSDYLTGPYEIMISPDRSYLVYEQAAGYDTVIRNIATGAETVIKDGKKYGKPIWGYDSKKLLLCGSDSISVFGLDGKQVGETIKVPVPYDNISYSTPVYTKDGLWYEGKV